MHDIEAKDCPANANVIAVWDRLVVVLGKYPCRRLQLDINVPNANEVFFGEWENVFRTGTGQSIYCSVPLVVEGQRVGTIRLFFDHENVNRDILLGLVAQLSVICEASISRYLKFGALDKSFSVLSFDTVSSDSVVLVDKKAA